MHRIGPVPHTALNAEVVAAPAGAWAAASCTAANARTSTAAMSAGRLMVFLTFVGGRYRVVPAATTDRGKLSTPLSGVSSLWKPAARILAFLAEVANVRPWSS